MTKLLLHIFKLDIDSCDAVVTTVGFDVAYAA